MKRRNQMRALFWATSIVVGLGCEQIVGLDGPYNTSIVSKDQTCSENAEEACYSGAPATLGVGVCKAGRRTCRNGVWSACVGEVVPTHESCSHQDLDCNGELTCAGDFVWGKSFGGSTEDLLVSVAIDSEDNILLAGRFDATLNVGGDPLTSAGGADIFVAKLKPSGEHFWSFSLGSSGNELGPSIAVDNAGNVAVVGTFEQPIDLGGTTFSVPTGQKGLFLAMYAADGTFRHGTTFYATDFRHRRIAFDPMGDVVLGIVFSGQVDFGGGMLSSQNDTPMAIAKFSGANVAHLWSKVFHGTEVGSAFIACDSMGNLGVAGTFAGTLNLGKNALVSVQHDGYLAKLTPAGEPIWSTSIGGSYEDTVNEFTIDSSDNWLVAGAWNTPAADGTITIGTKTFKNHGGASDMFLAKYSSDGAFVWANDLGSVGTENGGGLTADSVGNIFVAGISDSGMADLGFGPLGTPGLFVLKYDSSGNPLWMDHSTSAALSNGVFSKVVADSMQAIVIAGSFTGGLSFGGFSFPTMGGSDAYVMKVAF